MQEPTVLSSELNYVLLEHCVLSADVINPYPANVESMVSS
jgi:hypothetical protein